MRTTAERNDIEIYLVLISMVLAMVNFSLLTKLSELLLAEPYSSMNLFIPL
jgi:hypothetical protein